MLWAWGLLEQRVDHPIYFQLRRLAALGSGSVVIVWQWAVCDLFPTDSWLHHSAYTMDFHQTLLFLWIYSHLRWFRVIFWRKLVGWDFPSWGLLKMMRQRNRKNRRRDRTEVSCCIKYLMFAFNVIFWVWLLYFIFKLNVNFLSTFGANLQTENLFFFLEFFPSWSCTNVNQ